MDMSSYKLTYFNGKARGENIRYLFELASVKYEDERFVFLSEDWIKSKKPTFPFGQLPVLDIVGKQYPQSHAIWRYLAKEFGYYGDNNEQALQIDVVCEMTDDLWPSVVEIEHAGIDKAEKLEAKLRKKFLNGQVEKTVGYLEELLKQNNGGKGWFVGDKLSLADILVFNMIYDILAWILGMKEGEFDLKEKDALKGFIERFKSNENIASWIKRRPESEF